MSAGNLETDTEVPNRIALAVISNESEQADTLDRKAALEAPGFKLAARKILNEIIDHEEPDRVRSLDPVALEQEIFTVTSDFIEQLESPAQRLKAIYARRRIYGRLAGLSDRQLAEQAQATSKQSLSDKAIATARKEFIEKTAEYRRSQAIATGGKVVSLLASTGDVSLKVAETPVAVELKPAMEQFGKSNGLSQIAVQGALDRFDVTKQNPKPLTSELLEALNTLGNVFIHVNKNNPSTLTDLESALLQKVTGANVSPMEDGDSTLPLRYPLWLAAEELKLELAMATDVLAAAISKLN